MLTPDELTTLRIQIGHHKCVSKVVAISVERMESLFGMIDAQAAKIAELEQRGAQPPAVAVPDGYVQGIEDAAMLCQKEADELLSENRHVRNSEAETKAETASKLSEMLLSMAKDAAAQKGGQ